MSKATRVVIDGVSYPLDDTTAVDFSEAQSLSTAEKQQARTNIGAGDAADVTAIQALIGDTALPTTAQTITGAIAEHETDISDIKSAIGTVPSGSNLQGEVDDLKSALDDTESNIYGGNVNGVFVLGGLNFNVTPWVNTVNNTFISSKADYLFHLLPGDTISISDFVNCSLYVIEDNKGFASGWKKETVTIPYIGNFGIIIAKDSGNFASVSDVSITVSTSGNISEIKNIDNFGIDASVALDVSCKNNRRLANVDGEFVLSKNLFELGNIFISTDGFVYTVSGTRVRTAKNKTLHLCTGDIVSLSSGVFYPGWIDNSGDHHSGGGWKTQYTITQDGDYVFVMRYSTESTITDINAFLDGLTITPYNKGDFASNISKSLDVLRFNKFYDHFLLNKINGTNVIIPLQSIPSIFMSKRLGFKVIEANIKATSDNHYIVTHGTNGAFGAMFEHVDGETNIESTLINSVTLAWIKENIRYKSNYAKYRTAPPSLEEYLSVCKKLGMIPLAQIANDSNIADICNAIMGKDNYIAYNSNRDINSGFIMNVRDYTTKADIVYECETVGHPFMYFMSNPNYFTDSQLLDIIDTLHTKGYTIGFQDTYISEELANKYIQMGFDYCATTWNINDIECGNLWNVSGDIGFSDFDTDGTVNSDGNLVLANGQYVRKFGFPQKFLVGMVAYVRFSGTLKVNMSGNFRNGTYTSDGTEYVRISAGALNGYGEFMLTSTGETTIYELNAKASVL